VKPVKGRPEGERYAGDASVPAFWEDDRHVERLRLFGGFPRAVLDENGRSQWLTASGRRWTGRG
jgi:hypothetical protein